jgi:hypothetical protein
MGSNTIANYALTNSILPGMIGMGLGMMMRNQNFTGMMGGFYR